MFSTVAIEFIDPKTGTHVFRALFGSGFNAFGKLQSPGGGARWCPKAQKIWRWKLKPQIRFSALESAIDEAAVAKVVIPKCRDDQHQPKSIGWTQHADPVAYAALGIGAMVCPVSVWLVLLVGQALLKCMPWPMR